MTLRRQAIKLAASLPKGAERTAILNSVAAADKAAGCEKLPAGKMRENCESGGPIGKKKDKGKDKDDDKSEDKKDDKKKDDGKMPADLLEKFKGKKKASFSKKDRKRLNALQRKEDSDSMTKSENAEYEALVLEYRKTPEYKSKQKKASRSFLASFRGADAKLAREVVKLASRMPTQRTILLDMLRQAAGEEEASLANQGFDPSEISEVEGGPLEQEGDEPYMSDEFTQQEFHELGDLQESGALPTGSDEQKKYASARVAAAKTAATKKFRGNLIRIASKLPKGSRARQDMLKLLAS